MSAGGILALSDAAIGLTDVIFNAANIKQEIQNLETSKILISGANAAVQAASVVMDVIEIAKPPGVGEFPAGALLNFCGFATGLQVMWNDFQEYEQDRNSILPPDIQQQNVQADVLSLKSDGYGLLSNILGCFGSCLQASLNLPLIAAGKAFVAAAVLCNGESAYLAEQAHSDQNGVVTSILNFTNNVTAALRTQLDQVATNSAASTLLGPQVNAFVSNISGLVSAISTLINDDPSDPNFSNHVEDVQTYGSSLQSLFSSLLNTSGASSQDVSETFNGNNLSLTNTISSGTVASTFTVDGDESVNASSGSVDISSSDYGSTGDSTANSVLLPSSSFNVSSSLDSIDGGYASQTDQVASDGSLSQNFVFSGLSIQAPSTSFLQLDTSANDALALIISSPNSSDELTIVNTGAFDKVLVGNGTNDQELFSFGSSGLNLDGLGIDISVGADGSFDVTAVVGSEDGGRVKYDGNVSGVTQNFNFDSDNDYFTIYNSQNFYGTIGNFQAGDQLLLVGIETEIGLNNISASSDGLLKVPEASGGYVYLQLDPTQNYSTLNFIAENDGYGVDLIAGNTNHSSSPLVALAYDTVTNYIPVYTTITTTFGTYTNFDSFITTTMVYSAGASFQATNVDFGAERVGDALEQEVTLGISFVQGNLNPNDTPAFVSVSDGSSSDGVFFVQGAYDLSNNSNYSPSYGSIVVGEREFPYYYESGDFEGDVIPITVEYDGAYTTVAVTASAKVYAPAIPNVTLPGGESEYYDFGILHVGQTASVELVVTNGATGSLTDVLSSSAGTDGVFTAENTVSGLEAGQSGVITVSVESDLPGVYVANNESVCGFISQDPDLPNEQVNPGIVLSAEIYNYAQPVITNLSAYDGGTSFATLTQYGYNWNLNFGTIAKNSAQFYGGLLEIQNAVSDLTLSDGLAGIIVTHGSGFITSIPNSFNYEAILSLQPVDTKVGAHTLTIVIEPLSVDSSSTTALEYVTLTITDDVISSSGTGSSQGTISIISSGVTGGVVLGESRYSDNLTITSTGSVQYASLSGSGILGRDAVLAPAIAGTVSVVNAGSVVGQSAEAGGYGVALLGEGSLFNSGHISGGSGQEGGTGVGLTGNLGQLFVNSGQVYGGAGYEAGGNGVFAGNSAVVSNSGTILGGNATGTNAPGGYGGTGLVLTSGALTNTGLIAGGIGQSGGTGVEVLVGTLINNGTISAGVSEGGIADSQTTIAAIYLAQIGLVQNNGLADGVFGIELSGGGIIINSGKITGTTDGVALHANGTVTNTGIISGGVNAVAFAQGSDSRLIISANSDIIGAISGGGGVLELSADGHTAGKFSAAMNSQFADFATMQIDPGAIWDFTGRFTFGAATALVNDGTITEASTASLTIDAALTGTGVFDLSKKPLTLNGGVSSDEKISFTGTSETLVLGDPRGVKGKIEKFAAGDTIDLTSIKISAITATHFAGGVLTLTEASGKLQLTFASPASFGSKHFVLFKDGSGTGVTLSSATAALPSPTNAYTATTFSSASPTNGAVLGLLNIFATASSLPSLLKL